MEKRVPYKLAADQRFAVRLNQEPYPCRPYRNEFQRDRDRILYSKEFRRLSGKTQVFLPTSHDHVRNRLTHTLEVSQISRVTAENLSLDSGLAEAIALGHDVGHTPFGHAGEKTLNFIMNGCDRFAKFQEHMSVDERGFKHNLQSLRVTCDLEQLYGKPGLNLTNLTLWGISHHTTNQWDKCDFSHRTENLCMLRKNPEECLVKDGLQTGFYNRYLRILEQAHNTKSAWSFEAQVVKQADEIAQRHHDIEDAVFIEILTNEELLDHINSNFKEYFDGEDLSLFGQLNSTKNNNSRFLPLICKFVVSMLNKRLIENSIANLTNFIAANSISSRKDFLRKYPEISEADVGGIIAYSDAFRAAEEKLQKFLKNRILNSFEVQRMDGKGSFIIRRLFKAYLTNPRQLHDSTIHFVFKLYRGEHKYWPDISKSDLGEMRNEVDSTPLKSDPKFCISLLRAICDHIAGMTDNFALNEYEKMYG